MLGVDVAEVLEGLGIAWVQLGRLNEGLFALREFVLQQVGVAEVAENTSVLGILLQCGAVVHLRSPKVLLQVANNRQTVMGIRIARARRQHLFIALMGFGQVSGAGVLVVGCESVFSLVQLCLGAVPLGFGAWRTGKACVALLGFVRLFAEDREDRLLLLRGDVFGLGLRREPSQAAARLAPACHKQCSNHQCPASPTTRKPNPRNGASTRTCTESGLRAREDFRDQRGSPHRGLRGHVCTQRGKNVARVGRSRSEHPDIPGALESCSAKSNRDLAVT